MTLCSESALSCGVLLPAAPLTKCGPLRAARPPLVSAVDRGWMRKQRSLTAPPDMRALLVTLREIAAGMAFLHAKDVLHCDLTGGFLLGLCTDLSSAARLAGGSGCCLGVGAVRGACARVQAKPCC